MMAALSLATGVVAWSHASGSRITVNETSRHSRSTPFGGVKNSGVGREEDLEEIESCTQLNSVNIRFG